MSKFIRRHDLPFALGLVLVTAFAMNGCTPGGSADPVEEARVFTPDEFETLVGQDKLVLLKFGATWCGPCRKVDEELNAVASELPQDVEIVKIDVDANPDLAADLQVSGIPRLLLVRQSVVVADETGYMSRKQLSSWINSYR